VLCVGGCPALRYGKIASMAEPPQDPKLLLLEDLSKKH
jgi:hypothetical protein